ncbi:MAG: dihydrodipicolinate synthase family protein [Fibrobacteres bacterium]|nr:dihydrodipicolinate synthase family protein [Fibrobacterota bacterium]
MGNKVLPKPLMGIIPPLVTPLLDSDTLDTAGFQKLINHVIDGGVHGIFVLGTTGEAPSLSYRLRKEVIKRSCEFAGGRVPVLVGISDTSFVESVNLCTYSAECGADAVVLAPPFYFPAGQAELLEYLQHLVPKLALPLFLYNMPTHTKLVFEPSTVRAAADIPGIIGLKDSSANMVYFHKLQLLFKERADFSLLVGPEELLAETLLLGGHGGINGGANLWPSLYVSIYNAAQKRDLDTVMKLHEKVIQVSSSVYSVGKYSSSYLKGLKCGLSLLNICSDFMAEPFHKFRAEERESIRKHLTSLGILK